MLPIILLENEKWVSQDLPPQAIEDFNKWLKNPSRHDRQLIDYLKKKNWLDISQDPGGGPLRISSKGYVGSADFSEVQIRVIPKIYKKDDMAALARLTSVIDYADGVPLKNIIENHDIYVNYAEEPTLMEHYVKKLTSEIDELLRRGLLKSYVVHTEDTKSLRGKILLRKQIQNDAMQKVQFSCEYDELEYDNVENRMILQTLVACQRSLKNNEIGKELKRKIRKMIQQLSGVVSLVEITKANRKRVMNSYTRHNEHYKTAHDMCENILEHLGISDFYHGKQSHVQSFFVDMSKVFEKFVEKMFINSHSKHLLDQCPKCKNTDKVKVKSQRTEKSWENYTDSDKTMRPDLILMCDRCGTIREEIDMKYKDKVSVNDLYQVGFYMHEYGGKLNASLKRAFVILPDFVKKSGPYIATRSEKKVYEKRININHFMDKYLDDDQAELTKMVVGLSQE